MFFTIVRKFKDRIFHTSKDYFYFKNRVSALHKENKLIKKEEWQNIESEFKKVINAHPQDFYKGLDCLSFLKESTEILKFYEPDLLEKIKDMNTESLICTTRAYSRRKLGNHLFFQRILERTEKIFQEMTSDDINRLVFALYKAGVSDSQFFRMVGQQAANLVKCENIKELPDIIQTFSMVNCKEFLVSCQEHIEKNYLKLTNVNKLYLLKSFSSLHLTLPKTSSFLASNIQNLSYQEFALLTYYTAEYSVILNLFKEKIKKSIFLRNPSLFSLKDAMLIINSFHELDFGVQICGYFLDFVNENVLKFSTNQYPLILYVYGIHGIGNDFLWKTFIKRVHSDIKNFTIFELARVSYGLLIKKFLNSKLFLEIEKQALKQNINGKEFEKFIEVAAVYPKSQLLEYLKSMFKQHYFEMKPKKAIIYIEIFSQSKLMDEDLEKILKKLKSESK